MGFMQGLAAFPVVVSYDYDPAADEVLPVWRAPKACRIDGAYVTVVNDVAADTANYFALTLKNGGTAGAGTTLIGSQKGGTAGWTGLTPVSFGAAGEQLAAGDLVILDYDETGTGAFAQMTVQLDVRF